MELKIPHHIAIIMDGNGRWGQKKGLLRTYGHKVGAETLKKVLEHCGRLGVKILTVYAFSTENWKRSKEEVEMLMLLFKAYLKKERTNLMKNNVRFLVSGRKDGVSKSLLAEISNLEEETKENDGIIFNIAFNYGGRAEIVDAINLMIENGEKDVTEDTVKKYLYNDLPDPELLIRTSGELRISNFLLWQIAYSEIYVTDTLWPDFDENEMDKAIENYSKRNRRFGGVS